MRRLVLLLAVAVCACGDDAATEAASPVITPSSDAIAKTTETGPVKATVKVWPPKPVLGESIYVRLEIESPHGIDIDAPFQEAGDQRLGRFHVVAFTRDTRPSSGGQTHEQTYTLEAQASGKHRVPPLRFELLDARAGSGSAAKTQEVLTDEIPIDVQPVPLEKAASALHGAAGALDPNVGGTSALLVVGVISVLLVVGSGSILAVRARRARRVVEQQRSAYDDAMAHLQELKSRGAPDATAADDWFVELSAIVRRYLEHRYQIRAPELTTEEFLLVATARPEVSEDHRSMLTAFLERCDRVKFAGYRPEADESLATLEAARGFIEDTRLREVAA